MNTKPFIEQKKRNADMWLGQYDRYKDRSSAVNAAMAVGRLMGALELYHQLNGGELTAEHRALVEWAQEQFDRILRQE